MDVLASIAAYGLPASTPLPPAPADDETFAALLDECERNRLLGLLGAAVRAGDFHLSDAQYDELEKRLRAWLAHALRLERLLLLVHDCLRAAQVEHRILKGVALAHTVYPEPSWRVFGDIDILVESGAFPRAAGILEQQLGARRTNPERRPGFDARFGSAAELRYGRLELDVHRTLVYGVLGLSVDTGELIAEPRSFAVAGRQLQTLAAPQQLIHACYAAVLGDWPPRLAALRDVVQVHERLRPDPGITLQIAAHWRASAVVARALSHASNQLGLGHDAPLIAWARSYRPPAMERLLVSAYRGPARGYAIQIVSPLVIPGIAAKLAFMRGLVFPQRTFLDRRQLRWASFARLIAIRIRNILRFAPASTDKRDR